MKTLSSLLPVLRLVVVLFATLPALAFAMAGDAQDPGTDHSDEGKDCDVPSPQRTPGAGTGHEAIVPPHRWTRILGPRLLT